MLTSQYRVKAEIKAIDGFAHTNWTKDILREDALNEWQTRYEVFLKPPKCGNAFGS